MYRKSLSILSKIYKIRLDPVDDPLDEQRNQNQNYFDILMERARKSNLLNTEKQQKIAKNILAKLSKNFCLNVARILLAMGIACSKTNHKKQALQVLKTCQVIFTALLDSEHLSIFNTHLTMAYIYSTINYIEEAYDYFMKCITSIVRIREHEPIVSARGIETLAYFFQSNISYQKAIYFYDLAKKQISKIYGQESYQVSQLISHVGRVRCLKGDLLQSNMQYKQSLSIQQNLFGPQSLKLIQTLNGVANMYFARGRLDYALHFYNRSLQIKNKHHFQPHQIPIQHNYIALVYMKCGSYDKAYKIYSDHYLSISDQELSSKMNTLHLYEVLYNIATYFSIKGWPFYNRALSFYRQCQQLIKNNQFLLYKKYPVLLFNIGEVFCKIKKSLINQHQENALNLQMKISGDESLEAANILSLLAGVYNQSNQPQKALEQFTKCFRIQAKILGVYSMQYAQTLNNVGGTLVKMGENKSALKWYKDCLDIQILNCGYVSYHVAVSLNNIGGVHLRRKEYDEALKNYQQCLQTQQIILENDSLQIATTLNNIGSVYFSKTDPQYDKALQNFQKALLIYSKVNLDPDSIKIATALNNIGEVYLAKKEFKKALQYFRKCFQIDQKFYGKESPKLNNILKKIQQVQILAQK